MLNVRWIANYSATVIAFNNKKGHLKYTTCSVSLSIPYFEYINSLNSNSLLLLLSLKEAISNCITLL